MATRSRIFSYYSIFLLFHCGQHVVQGQRGEGGGVVGHGVGDDELPAVQETAAGIDHIGHVTLALIFVRLDEWLAHAADYLSRILPVEQEGADAVFAHRPYTVAEDKPAGVDLDGRTAVAQLNKLPGKGRFQEELRG